MDLEKLTIKQVFGRLHVGQLWALLGVITGLVAGAFTLGYHASTLASDPKLAERDALITAAKLELEKQSTELKKATTELDDAGTKERFLSLYLRFLIAQKNKDVTEEAGAREALDEFVRQFVDSKELVIHKGGGRLATIKFRDGTIWELPREIHAVAKQ